MKMHCRQRTKYAFIQIKKKTSKKSTRYVVSKRSGEKSDCQNTDNERVRSLVYSSKPHVGFKLSPEEERWTSYHPGQHVYHPLCLQCTQNGIGYSLFLLFFFGGGEIAHLDSDHCVSTAGVKAAFSCNFHRGLNPRRCIRHLPPPQSSPSDAPLLISLSDAKMGSAPGSWSATENVLISDTFCQLGNIWLDVFRLSTTHIVKLEQVMMPAVREICKVVGR